MKQNQISAAEKRLEKVLNVSVLFEEFCGVPNVFHVIQAGLGAVNPILGVARYENKTWSYKPAK